MRARDAVTSNDEADGKPDNLQPRCSADPAMRAGSEAENSVGRLDAGIAGGDGDLLGTVAVTAEAGFAYQHLEAVVHVTLEKVPTPFPRTVARDPEKSH